MRGPRFALGVVVLAVAAVIGGLAAGGTMVPAAGEPLVRCPAPVRGLGRIMVAVRGGFELIDLSTCRVVSYRAGGVARVGFSPDGRWVGYSAAAGGPRVMPAGGGAVRRPFPAGITSWFWGEHGARLYGVDTRGELLTTAPAGRPRLVARGVGAVIRSPRGGLVASARQRCTGQAQGRLSVIALATGTERTIFNQRLGQPWPATFSPDGRWLLYWRGSLCSASLAADGFPLQAIPTRAARSPVTAIRHMLLFGDFLTWCGDRLIAAAGPSRETQRGSRLVTTAPPTWHTTTIQSAHRLSWVSPSCTPDGHTLAAAAGPGTQDAGFGVERRSIWLLRSTGAILGRLTDPPAGTSDESPRFSRDGHWILFVRTRVITRGLSAYSQDTLELVHATAHPAQPIPLIDFISDDFSYYDHFDWPQEIAWSSGPQQRGARCVASQLRLAAGARVSEMTEQATRVFGLRNVSRSGCTLTGYPTVALVDGRGRPLPFRYRDHGDQELTAAAPRAVDVPAGGWASFAINKNSCVGPEQAEASRIRVRLPGQARPLTLMLPRYPLLGYCGGADPGHTVDITPIEAAQRDLWKSTPGRRR